MFVLGSALILLTTSIMAHAWRGPDISHKAQAGMSCAGLGRSSTDTPTYALTLMATNTTLPNTNKVGVPLALGWCASESDVETRDWVMSVSLAIFQR